MNGLYSYITKLLYIYLNIRMIEIFLRKKERNSIFPLLFYVLISSVSWSLDFLSHFQKIIAHFLFLYLYSVHYFDAKIPNRLSVIILSMGLTNVTQGITYYFCRYSNLALINWRYYSFIPCFLTLALIMVWEYCLSSHKINATQTVYHFQVIFICLSSISLCGILISVTAIPPAILCFCLFAIHSINILSLIMYSKLNIIQQKEIERKTLEQRVLMYQNQFQIMEQSQNELHALRHDLKNHLLLIEKYLENNQSKTAIQYIKDLTQTHFTMQSYVDTGNSEIDCVFNYLLGIANQIGCHIQTSIKIPSHPFVSALDFNILISNLLTNAIEAMEASCEKYLNIAVKYDRSILYISIYNTYQGKRRKQDHYFLTTKEDQQLHGYGFKNIHAVIEKYHGSSHFRTEGNIFKADIILYMKVDNTP